jgi:CubicO group peptidase (beta-lactamase class C family)
MVTPVRLNSDSLYPYGFGWFLNPVNGHKAYQHSGSWQGYNTYIARFPDDNLTVIVLINLSPSNPGLIARDIAALYVPELGRKKLVLIKDDNTALTNLVLEIFKNPNETILNNPLISKEGIAKVKAVLASNRSLLKIFGQVQHIEAVESSNKNQNRYLIKYKAGSRLALVNKNNQGQIISVVSESY